MANYVSRGAAAKKIEAFKQLEASFRIAVRQGDARAISKLAERLRKAKLAEIKARMFPLTANPSDADRSGQVLNLEAEAERWANSSVEQIEEFYS